MSFSISSSFIRWLLQYVGDVQELCRLREFLKKEVSRRIEASWSRVELSKLRSELKSYLGDVSLMPWDRYYKVINYEGLQQIIKVDWTDLKRYRPERFDCDDFASIFYSNSRENYLYTGVGFCIGEIKDKEKGNLIGVHAYNLCFYMKDGELGSMLFEPQNDLLDEDRDRIIKDWKYETMMVIL